MVRDKKIEQLNFVVALMGAMMMICFWLIVATFPDFFFFSPKGVSSDIRRAELVLSTFGWIALSTGAPFSMFLFSAGYFNARKALPFMALVWPISLVISQITVYVLDGHFYLDYLIKFPIFIFTDLILPAFVLFIWWDIRDHFEGIDLSKE